MSIRPSIPEIQNVKDPAAAEALKALKNAVEMITGRGHGQKTITALGPETNFYGLVQKLNEVIYRLQSDPVAAKGAFGSIQTPTVVGVPGPTQTTTLTGDVSGSGTTSIETTLATVITSGTAGTTNKVPVIVWDAKGRLTQVTTATVTASTVDTVQIGTATYHTLQDMQNLFHSSGLMTWAGMTDNGNGTVNVAAGTGLIRATDSATAELKWFNWSANTTLALTNNDENFIYVDYNAGAPQIAVALAQPASRHTTVMLGKVYRNGTDLHINQRVAMAVGDHAAAMAQEMQEVMPYARVSGAVLTETGTRNIAVSAGVFWNGLNRFTLSAIDTSAAGTFNYDYRNGAGGWTEVATQTQIDNTQYDDGDGALGTLTANRYGVHWIYLGVDNDLHAIYGQGDYTLTNAQSAQPPASIPPELETVSFLIGKIIIQKNAAVFTSVESAFAVVFNPLATTVHNELSGLQGGTTDEYYHLTAAQSTAFISQAQVAARVSLRT